jgi:polar amino acid transport system substrate-binding protein
MISSVTLNRLIMIAALSALASACGDVPRDPEGTLRSVQGGRLRVGLVEHPPWVVRAGGEPRGAEVELVRRFAAELGATPEWNWGGEQQQMEALEHFQLDLVVGGVTKSTPWSDYVGLTSTYFEEKILVGVPSSTAPPEDIKGMRVAAQRGTAVAAYLKSEGAVPEAVDDLRAASGGAVAAPDWQVEALGLTRTRVELHAEKHVMAVPPGENGWLKRLEEFLHRQRPQIKTLLQQEEARR